MNRFRVGLFIRVCAIGLTTVACIFLAFHLKRYVGASLFAFLLVLEVYLLFTYVEGTNQKLTRFLQSIRYSDFETSFVVDNRLGRSFRELNTSFNEVLEAFREARAESEEHLQYLNTVVRHIGIGIISFDETGRIELLNAAACRLTGISRIGHIRELEAEHPRLLALIQEISPNSSLLFRISDQRQLSVQATSLRLRGKTYKLVSLQNIHKELQAKELEAWQNLAVALRHEIMNSITPIASMVATLQEMMEEEFRAGPETLTVQAEVAEDLRGALATIEKRSRGLIRFINAYRDFTRIPEPVFDTLLLANFFREIHQLMEPDMQKSDVAFSVEVEPKDLRLQADGELLQMALINLLKNAREAVEGREGGRVSLRAHEQRGELSISVEDNGPGIIPQALEKIFIPFYSTKSKKGGSGIGLSLARQIILLHNGSLSVASIPNERTTFVMRFERGNY